jgi:hypothetical protein
MGCGESFAEDGDDGKYPCVWDVEEEGEDSRSRLAVRLDVRDCEGVIG